MALDAHQRANANSKSRMPANLQLRPVKPAYRNGPIQRIVLRAIEALRLANTTQIAQWAYCERHYRGQGLRLWHYEAVRRALEQVGARRVERGKTRGRPWIWRAKEPKC
jgi:hypothetical protein